MSAPALPCPPWCTSHYAGEVLGRIRTSAMHRTDVRWFGAVSVQALQLAAGGGETPYLMFDGTDVSLRDARRLAHTLERLGHPEIAAAIRELAALAGGDR